MSNKKCTNCNGSGSISNHTNYRHDGQRSSGMGQSACPSCNGSGKGSSHSEDSTSSAAGGFVVLFLFSTWGGAAFLYKLFDTEVEAGIVAVDVF